MEKRCDYCGTLLKVVDGKLFCPNCGIVDEMKDDDSNYRSYIG